MTKFQIGDKVTVRSDLELNTTYGMEGNPYVDIAVNEMVDFAGKTVTIKEVDYHDGNLSYEIEEDKGAWSWTDEMFE